MTGANLTKTRNYVTGVTGQYLVTGTNASEFIKAGVLGVVGDQTTTADGAVVAYLDGDGGLTTANAAYAVSMKNSTAGSGFNYGLDLQFINLNLAGVTSPYKQADIRFNNGVTLVANTTGNVVINANITSTSFIGAGNNLSNIQGSNVNGAVGLATFATTANAVSGANVSGAVAFATTANSVAVANVSGIGNIAVLNLDGNLSNILYGNGVFAALPISTYGNSNVATFLASYGSNTISTTGNVTVGNIIGNGQALTGLAGANVTGQVTYAATANSVAGANVSGAVTYATTANSVAGANVSGAVTYATTANSVAGANVSGAVTYATTANSVALANVSGAGNIASININGNASQILYGNGVFAASPVTYDNSNVATFLASYGSNTITTTGNVSVGNIIGNGQALTGLAGANVSGAVTYATTANAVAGANVSGAVAFATTANAVAGANVSGAVSFASTANSVAVANVSGIGNIATTNYSGNGSQVLAGNGAWIASSTSSVTITVDNFTGTGSQTAFNLSVSPSSINQTSINYNGATVLRTDYSVLGNLVTFSSAPASGSLIEVTTTNLVSGSGGGGSALTIQDEGSTLTTTASLINFVGNGVVATNTGNSVTVTVNTSGATAARALGYSLIFGG